MTTVINFIAPPGAGKTFMTNSVYVEMIKSGFNVEPVSEYAKELVFEQRHETMKNEIYLFAKQHQRLFRLKEKVPYIVTDRPIILSVLYNNKYGTGSEKFNELIIEEHNRYNNINILLKRTMPYKQIGRHQSEEESDVMYYEIMEFLNEYGISYIKMDSDENTCKKVIELLKEKTNK